MMFRTISFGNKAASSLLQSQTSRQLGKIGGSSNSGCSSGKRSVMTMLVSPTKTTSTATAAGSNRTTTSIGHGIVQQRPQRGGSTSTTMMSLLSSPTSPTLLQMRPIMIRAMD
eukprot:CAMPEP_0202468646 /NCGR_PEP_ID=MMETSP1360-20130828/75869_1 /ASSEMBLY_ACC=CAM_ASM_000848 /TAXON_ID=515479 /ORGANISM="Licmophora paradoxa, Strain CCMP2313" /LENGTH=112 /DNA_ID=CAMNT_0049093677 /DNA_START=85 /DNA_END=420 /DNA_ORIENTATION=+